MCIAYRLQIKRDDHHPPIPYKWEIYEGDKPLWVKRSLELFPSIKGKAIQAGIKGKAIQAGTEALSSR